MLLRLVPLACAAFVDLVRARQGNPIPAFTAMSGCGTHIETQIGHLQARAGRLVAVGITREGGDVNVAIEAKPRKAIYDGLITFEPPERDHSAINTREPVTLTVESKLDSLGGSWQLMPSEGHLPPPEEEDGKRPLQVDSKAVVLAWRDIFRSLTDLESRNLLNSSESVLVRDFLQYVRSRHPSLNPFDRFALCGRDIGLLNRRCEEVLRQLEPNVAWTRTRPSRPFIGVESAAFQRIFLYAEFDKNGQLVIRMGIWPGGHHESGPRVLAQSGFGKTQRTREFGGLASTAEPACLRLMGKAPPLGPIRTHDKRVHRLLEESEHQAPQARSRLCGFPRRMGKAPRTAIGFRE